MIRYIMHTHMIINMKGKRLPSIAFNFNTHSKLTRVWHENVDSWLSHWRLEGYIKLEG